MWSENALGFNVVMLFLERLRFVMLNEIWFISQSNCRRLLLLQFVWVMLQMQVDGHPVNDLHKLRRVKISV